MFVIDGLLAWPWESAVVTMGAFDGVHLGHAALLERTVAVASQHDWRPVVLTFEPHPDRVLRPGQEPALLTTAQEKAALIGRFEIWALVRARFDQRLAEMEPADFVRRVLAGRLGARHLVVGHRARFGKDGRGDLALLREVGASVGLEVECVGPVLVDGEEPSSTLIRELLLAGEVARANCLLGRAYELRGEVVAGEGRGRRLGFPTANLAVSGERLVPAVGVYVGLARWDELLHLAVVNIGRRPTFGGGPLVIEAFVPDFEGELYGREMAVRFLARLRGERRFPDAGALVAQMARDVAEARQTLASLQGRGDVLE